MKRCTKCGELKQPSEFYKVEGCKDGLRGDCKACHRKRQIAWYAKNRERAIKNASDWRKSNLERARATRRARYPIIRDKLRDDHLQRNFDITLAEYEAMLERQGGGCAICQEPPKPGSSLHVDHDHETGEVRGLLCVRCNGGLGQFAEDVDRLAIAREYLTRDFDDAPMRIELQELAVTRARGLIGAPD